MMGANTNIEWTDHTFNPWVGCQQISTGCKHCYAEATVDGRFHRGAWGLGGIRQKTKDWSGPIKWEREAHTSGQRRKVFCASWCDVFEHSTPIAGEHLDRWRLELWQLIDLCPSLDWQLLTKRPENIMQMVPFWWKREWPANVWIGTSVEDQHRANERIPGLLNIPAKVRFLSCEPLLGPVDLVAACPPDWDAFDDVTCDQEGWDEPEEFVEECEDEFDWINYGHDLVHSREHKEWIYDRTWMAKTLAFANGIHWVICGGESGRDARPMHPDWAFALRDQCVGNDFPFFFKQWGEYDPDGNKVGKAKAANLLNGKIYQQFPGSERT